MKKYIQYLYVLKAESPTYDLKAAKVQPFVFKDSFPVLQLNQQAPPLNSVSHYKVL